MAKRVLLIVDESNIIEAIGFTLSRDGWTSDPNSGRVQSDWCGS